MLLPPAHTKTEVIEVVRITDPMRRLSSEDLAGDDVAIWGTAQADQVLTLVKGLPGSEVHRCFTPGWGIRAHSATDLLFQVAFCFRCHGARLWGPRVPAAQTGVHGFDPDSPPACELLERFRGSQTGCFKGLFQGR